MFVIGGLAITQRGSTFDRVPGGPSSPCSLQTRLHCPKCQGVIPLSLLLNASAIMRTLHPPTETSPTICTPKHDAGREGGPPSQERLGGHDHTIRSLDSFERIHGPNEAFGPARIKQQDRRCQTHHEPDYPFNRHRRLSHRLNETYVSGNRQRGGRNKARKLADG
jgi:hypothetical protein